MSIAIPLYSRTDRQVFTCVDDQDYEWVMQWRWRLSSRGYTIRSDQTEGREVVVALHRALLLPPPGMVVDHIDHDKLNNTRANLRIITQQQNLMNRRLFRNNTSGFKGVTYQHDKWHARIEKDGQLIHLGFYDDPVVAAGVYDCAAVLLFGRDYVWLNLPEATLSESTLREVGQLLESSASPVTVSVRCR
jgi:hypothetical protein